MRHFVGSEARAHLATASYGGRGGRVSPPLFSSLLPQQNLGEDLITPSRCVATTGVETFRMSPSLGKTRVVRSWSRGRFQVVFNFSALRIVARVYRTTQVFARSVPSARQCSIGSAVHETRDSESTGTVRWRLRSGSVRSVLFPQRHAAMNPVSFETFRRPL